jgi:nucleoside-diphosphate-sugar epimerase
LRYLVTGGAGFIGSHLTDSLAQRGDQVLVLDDLSTGTLANLEDALETGRVEFVEGSVCDEDLVVECMESVDVCLHMAAAVGVKLIVDRPVDSLLRNVRGTDLVISAAAALRRKLLYASTSEIYGKNGRGALNESSDRILGPPSTTRWSYSTSKAFGEVLAFGYHRELGAQMVVARLFNTVGPRQTGFYGMVLPRFVRQALAGEDLTVYGDGTQTRCFAHVADTVRALLLLLDCEEADGAAFNVGSTREIEILELARRIIDRTGSDSQIRFIPLEVAYEPGFEEVSHRRPATDALMGITGWAPQHSVDTAIDDVIAYEREALALNGQVRVV